MRLPVLALATLLLTGCLSAGQDEVPAAAVSPQGVVIDEARPDTAFGEIVTGPAVGPDLNATLDAPPRLVAGEWWRVRFDPGFGGEPVQAVRVVAEVLQDGYVIGMPHEGWYAEAISFHSPAFGDVGLDLSYATHNEVFEPVRFPLVEGATWETVFATTPFSAVVEEVSGARAVIAFTSVSEPQPTDPVMALFGMAGGTTMRLTYDAGMHEIVKMESDIGGFEVLEHGYGFEGWITIPRGEHTAIDYGQFLTATPGEPVVSRTIEVAGGFNRLTLMHGVFPLAPGAYRVRTVAPDGSEFLTESLDGAPVLRFYEAKDPDGTWQAEDLVAGAGATYSMGIAYHQYDIRLPDGLKRSDHSHEVVR